MAKKQLTEDMPSNSNSSRVAPIRPQKLDSNDLVPPEKRIRKSIKGRAVVKKKTLSQSVAHSFFSEDTKNVGFYIINDVLIPAAKNLIQEMISSGIEMLLFGETKPRGRSKDRDRSIVSYGSFYRGRDRDDDRRESRRHHSPRDKFDLSDIYFRDHTDAEEVLDGLCEALEEYDQVTVADYFELAGIDGAIWTHNKYGWDDLRKAYCTHTRNGYAIVLPDPIELD